MSVTKRYFLGSLLFLGLVIPTSAAVYFQVTLLAPDLLMLSTDQGSYCNNSLLFSGVEGMLLVDTHSGSDGDALKEFVDSLGFGPPRYIINTHRHEEHIGGNALFGPDPIIIAHHLFPDKLRSGTFLFSEYPSIAFPDITLADSLELFFNGELIRLVNISGSHDDNEIMVHFTSRGIAHISSVVNGFNFPSIDKDGDLFQFEPQVRRLMQLLPQDVRLVSGHNGRGNGFEFLGSWDQLAPYAEMMKTTVEIVRQELAEGRTLEEMQNAGVLNGFKQYAGSYVGTDDWLLYLVDALTVPGATSEDICIPLFEAWKQEGAQAAVDCYRRLVDEQEEKYDFHETTLLSIGAKLYTRGLYADAIVFLLGCAERYPEGDYTYYTHYLIARGFQKLDRLEEAVTQCRESLRLKPEFEDAAGLLKELSAVETGQ